MNINIITANAADTSGNTSRSSVEGKNVSGKEGQSFARTLEKANNKASNNSQAESSKTTQTAREKSSAKPVSETDAATLPNASETPTTDETTLAVSQPELSDDALAMSEFSPVEADETDTDETTPAVAPWLFGVANATVTEDRQLKGLTTAKNAIAEHQSALPRAFVASADTLPTSEDTSLTEVVNSKQTIADGETVDKLVSDELSNSGTSKDSQRTTPVLPQQASDTAANKIAELAEHLPKAANRSPVDAQQAGINTQPLNSINPQRVGGSEQMTALQLATPINHANWSQEFGQRLSVLAMRGENQVSLHLNPRELGPLVVDLKMIDNQAQMHIFSNHNQVRAAVEQAIPQLRESLEEQGITLGEATVSQQQHQEQRDNAGNNSHQGNPALADDSFTSGETGVSQPNMVIDDGRVSLYI